MSNDIIFQSEQHRTGVKTFSAVEKTKFTTYKSSKMRNRSLFAIY